MSKEYKNPFLVIETPRAGKWNHRHIVAPGIPQQAYLDIIEIARQKSEGDNFLAVGHDNKVKQFTTDRRAPELLILAGVDTKLLSKNQKQALQDLLTSLLRSVDKLVTEDIDWNREGETDPVAREELAVWFSRHFKDIETIAWNPKFKGLPKKIMSEITVVLLVSLGLGWYFFPKTEIQDPDVTVANDLIDALSNEKSSAEEVSKELIELGIIENLGSKFKISNNIKDIDQSLKGVLTRYIFPEGISELLLIKEVDLNSPDVVKKLISCKEKIITFPSGSQGITLTPFITLGQVNDFKDKIKKHRKEENKSYIDSFDNAPQDVIDSCSEKLANEKPLEFLKSCYEKLGIKRYNRNEFWGNYKSLLETCGQVKS